MRAGFRTVPMPVWIAKGWEWLPEPVKFPRKIEWFGGGSFRRLENEERTKTGTDSTKDSIWAVNTEMEHHEDNGRD
jgi:hypothetical protein